MVSGTTKLLDCTYRVERKSMIATQQITPSPKMFLKKNSYVQKIHNTLWIYERISFKTNSRTLKIERTPAIYTKML